MAAQQAYLVRREADGTMRTVQAQSCRGAMASFLITYRPPVDEVYRVKPREAGNWEYYKITPSGIRKLRG
jgi:hypothetical protein